MWAFGYSLNPAMELVLNPAARHSDRLTPGTPCLHLSAHAGSSVNFRPARHPSNSPNGPWALLDINGIETKFRDFVKSREHKMPYKI